MELDSEDIISVAIHMACIIEWHKMPDCKSCKGI